MEIVAHRGAHERFPENSIPAFEEAVRLGADGIEFDVRLTKDGVPVVIHWLELEKAVGREGYLFDVTFEELRREKLLGLEAEEMDAAVPTLGSPRAVRRADRSGHRTKGSGAASCLVGRRHAQGL